MLHYTLFQYEDQGHRDNRSTSHRWRDKMWDCHQSFQRNIFNA